MKGYGPVDAMEYPRFSGIRTFMRLPHVQDLSSVDFAIIGAPLVMANFRRGTSDNVDGDIGLGNQRLDQRTLARADLTEEAQVNRPAFLPGRQFLQLLARQFRVDPRGLGLQQPFLDLFPGQLRGGRVGQTAATARPIISPT